MLIADVSVAGSREMFLLCYVFSSFYESLLFNGPIHPLFHDLKVLILLKMSIACYCRDLPTSPAGQSRVPRSHLLGLQTLVPPPHRFRLRPYLRRRVMASNSSDEETFANFHRMQRPIKNLLAPSPADHGHDGVFAKRQPPVKIAAVTSETAKSPALKKTAANFP